MYPKQWLFEKTSRGSTRTLPKIMQMHSLFGKHTRVNQSRLFSQNTSISYNQHILCLASSICTTAQCTLYAPYLLLNELILQVYNATQIKKNKKLAAGAHFKPKLVKTISQDRSVLFPYTDFIKFQCRLHNSIYDTTTVFGLKNSLTTKTLTTLQYIW